MSEQQEHDQGQGQRSRGADWLEKAATAVSGIILVAILAYLVWDGVHANTPAAVTAVSAGTGEIRGESRYVPVAVENAGDEAVRDVKVSVETTAGGQKVEGEFEIEWLPGHSRRQGVAILPKESVGQPLRATVKGYAIP